MSVSAAPEILPPELYDDSELLERAFARRQRSKFSRWFPDDGPCRRALYPKHIRFLAAGADYRERCFVAANRTGKSETGAFESTAHLTGLYPHWWIGKRYDRPVQMWACGTTGKKTREVVQAKLCGRLAPEEEMGHGDHDVGLGTGMIPGHLIVKHAMKQGTPNAIDMAWVRHVTGGLSCVTFKSYEQGREGFDGDAVEVIWLDEECPMDIYTESLLRTMTVGGIVMVTFTPLQGLTPLVLSFMPGGTMPPMEQFAPSQEAVA